MTMTDSPAKPLIRPNIDDFDTYAAEVLSRLFLAFPLRIPLDPQDLTGGEAPDPDAAPDSEEGRRRLQFEIAVATVTWLRDEGYIVAPWHGHLRFHGCVLTAKGLRALLQLPDRLAADRTVGDRLITATRDLHAWFGPETVRRTLGLES